MKDINNLLQQKSNLLLKISSLPLNLFPYLVFSLIIKQNTAISVLPFALFYAFRRTTLFLFKAAKMKIMLLAGSVYWQLYLAIF